MHDAEPWLLGRLAAVWTIYFVIHSLLAAHRVKTAVALRWPGLMPAYRLLYNLLAVVLLVPAVWLTLAWPGDPLWQWHGAAQWIANAAALAAIAGFVLSLRAYDGGHFVGLAQLRNRTHDIEGGARLRISSLHRHVRHPWYSLGLLLIWSREMDAAMLLGALACSAYLLVGSMLEERKLVARFGEPYRRYQRAVPGLLPRPWRRLRAEQAVAIERMAEAPKGARSRSAVVSEQRHQQPADQ